MRYFSSPASLAILLMGFCPGGADAQEGRLGECLAVVAPSEEETFLTFDGELRAALASDDPTYLTLLASYPLRVNDNGGTINIRNATTLYNMSETVFPEALRNQVLNTDLADVICNSSGIGYGSGRLWIKFRRDGDGGRFEIRSVNLPRVQGESSTSIEFVCRTSEFRSVVDRGFDGALRLRSWNVPRLVSEAPDLELFSGRQDSEGTSVCAHRIFSFEDEDTTYSMRELGCSAAPPPENSVGTVSIRMGGTEVASAWCF